MAKPHNLEDTMRVHDVAIWNWLGNLHVDYNSIDHGVVKNDVPIIRVFAAPMREFATVVETLIKTGWITGADPATQAANAGDFAILPLPVLTVRRGEPEIDSELSAPAKLLTTKAYDPKTGQYVPHPWPGFYRTSYTVTLWSLKRYSDSFMREWVMSQFGANRGASYKEYMLPVEHVAPWGVMPQALRFDGSSDLSDLEGESQRYLRVEFTFSLRTLFMRNVQPYPDGQGTPVNRIGIIAGVPDSTEGDTTSGTMQTEEFGQVAIQSANLFRIPVADYLIPEAWPVTGTATVTRGRVTPGGHFLQPNGDSLYFEVAGSLDSAPIVTRQTAADTQGNSIVSISFQYLSNGPVMLEMHQEDPVTGIVSMAYELMLPPQAQWTKIHVFALAGKNIFSWNVTGIGTNPRYGITVAGVDVRHISTLTQRSPDQILTTADETQYLWYNLPPGAALVEALLLSNSGVTDTLSVDNDAMSPTYTNTQPVSSSVNVGLVALIQPLQNTIRVRVPLTVSLASIGLQVYAGAYNGHDLSLT